MTEAVRYMATLIRGRMYIYKRIKFERQVPVQVTEEMAEELAELHDEIKDQDPDLSNRQAIRKKLFRIEAVNDASQATKLPTAKRKFASAPTPAAPSGGVKPKPRPVTRIGGSA